MAFNLWKHCSRKVLTVNRVSKRSLSSCKRVHSQCTQTTSLQQISRLASLSLTASSSNLFSNVRCSCYCHLRKPLAVENHLTRSLSTLGIHSNDASNLDENNLEPKSLPLDNKDFLGAVNELSAEELYRYQYFTKPICNGIVKMKERVGIIKSTEELLQVPGVTEERLMKLRTSLGEQTLKNQKTTVSGLGSLLHPRLKLAEVPSTIVSLHIHLPHISWIHMSRDFEVISWETTSLADKKKLKYDHAMYQNKLWELCPVIPTADLYLLEEMPLRVNTNQIMPTINRNYVEASITTSLTLRHCTPQKVTSPRQNSMPYDQLIRSPDGNMISTGTNSIGRIPPTETEFKHSVYKLKPKAVSEHFSLLVGGERTSSLTLLRHIMQGKSQPADGVHADGELWDKFWALPNVLQDQHAQTLLVATTFYKLLYAVNEHKQIDN